MNAAKLKPLTAGFVLATAVTALFNTALACVKDVNPPLKAFLKSIAGHDWTTQGFADLLLFLALGWLFVKAGTAEKIDAGRLTAILIAAVAIAAVGLALWFAVV